MCKKVVRFLVVVVTMTGGKVDFYNEQCPPSSFLLMLIYDLRFPRVEGAGKWNESKESAES